MKGRNGVFYGGFHDVVLFTDPTFAQEADAKRDLSQGIT